MICNGQRLYKIHNQHTSSTFDLSQESEISGWNYQHKTATKASPNQKKKWVVEFERNGKPIHISHLQLHDLYGHVIFAGCAI